MKILSKKIFKETLVPIKWAPNGILNLMLSLWNLNSTDVTKQPYLFFEKKTNKQTTTKKDTHISDV